MSVCQPISIISQCLDLFYSFSSYSLLIALKEFFFLNDKLTHCIYTDLLILQFNQSSIFNTWGSIIKSQVTGKNNLEHKRDIFIISSKQQWHHTEKKERLLIISPVSEVFLLRPQKKKKSNNNQTHFAFWVSIKISKKVIHCS